MTSTPSDFFANVSARLCSFGVCTGPVCETANADGEVHLTASSGTATPGCVGFFDICTCQIVQ